MYIVRIVAVIGWLLVFSSPSYSESVANLFNVIDNHKPDYQAKKKHLLSKPFSQYSHWEGEKDKDHWFAADWPEAKGLKNTYEWAFSADDRHSKNHKNLFKIGADDKHHSWANWVYANDEKHDFWPDFDHISVEEIIRLVWSLDLYGEPLPYLFKDLLAKFFYFDSKHCPDAPEVPLPAALPLFSLSLLGLGWLKRRRL